MHIALIKQKSFLFVTDKLSFIHVLFFFILLCLFVNKHSLLYCIRCCHSLFIRSMDLESSWIDLA
jgi:hypothetical protein